MVAAESSNAIGFNFQNRVNGFKTTNFYLAPEYYTAGNCNNFIYFPYKKGNDSYTLATIEDITGSSIPPLPENFVAVGQSGSIIGGTSNLSFLYNSSLRVIADNSPSDGIFLSDGRIDESYAGLYSPNGDQEIIAFSPNNSNYRLFDNKYNYNTITGIHNISGSLIVTEYKLLID